MLRGALIEFEVIYNNDTDRFLNFRDFLVELVDESDKNHRFKARTYWTRIEFRNCSEDYEIEGMNTVAINNVTCIHNLPMGNYTVSVLFQNSIAYPSTLNSIVITGDSN